MLILCQKQFLFTNKINITVPWDIYFYEHKITKLFDETDQKIVADVEQTSLINPETILGKFSDMPIGIGSLSDGCKTLLCINHAIKTKSIDNYLFNITECGGNAVSYLASVMSKTIDIYAYIEHYDFGIANDCNIKIGTKLFHNTILAANALAKLQNIE